MKFIIGNTVVICTSCINNPGFSITSGSSVKNNGSIINVNVMFMLNADVNETGLALLFRRSHWSSENEGSPDIFISDHYSDSSEDHLKDSELESDLDEDDVLEMCSCSCDETVCDSDIDEDDLKTVYVGIDEADSLCIKLTELIKRGKIQKERIFFISS